VIDAGFAELVDNDRRLGERRVAGLKGANLLRVKGVLNVEGDPVVAHAR
jgi:hypothetical protein